MTAKHTPGPLHAYVVGKGITPGVLEYGVAHETTGKPLARGIYNGADAVIYAAAPDMATEIHKQIDWLNHAKTRVAAPASIMLGFDQSIKLLEAVLAKAEGRL